MTGYAIRQVRRRSYPDPNERIPPGVEEVISRGSCHIGRLNDTMVLKYASDFNDPGYLMSIKVENRILQLLGPHPRIIESKGLAEDGLILKYYPNGTLRNYIKNHPYETLECRLEWCKQLVDTLSFVHSKRVIHCDICLHNILLDENFDIILADFQGLVISSTTGRTMLDGLTRECAKSYMPRENLYSASFKTDLFAVGSAIYHLIVGHEVFPELDSFDDEKEINARFINGHFPKNDYVASHIVERCWRGEYASAAEISIDIAEAQAATKAVDEVMKQLDAEEREVEEGEYEEDEEYEDEAEDEEEEVL
ncbi:BR serine/threonine-protein kinase [Penicillium samsonianum]|uniref:BR serine/threonine-protein kinase n=1 Tax=Penicillium samsonianum TaxID=1882272 RepID=UPI00254658C4|nr:BR serine/threonine-protein kinase [Penicillium samsonianum]KAJ6140220.1 BR serine/threonine-protein kinase [Penicillium samsonianum]